MLEGNELPPRVLALDPVSRGFGFVVFEGPKRLVDWGVIHVRQDKQLRCLAFVSRLLDRYAPDVLVLENHKSRSSRRCRRVRQLLRAIQLLASAQDAATRAFGPRTVRKVFARLGARNKDQTAAIIAARFAELDPYVPPVRRPWMSEDERLAIFDAAALALTYFERGVEAAKPPANPTHIAHA